MLRRGLYVILDQEVLRAEALEPVELATALCELPLAALQWRAKESGSRDILAMLRVLVPLCQNRGVPFFAKDRADLAALAGCDGVHVGQHDMRVGEVRKAFPRLQIGVSTHDLEQLQSALPERPDYVAFGPVFPTASKRDPEATTGLAALEQASAQVGATPLVAIGGIEMDSARQVARLATGGDVIGGIVRGAGSVPEAVLRARALHDALSYGTL